MILNRGHPLARGLVFLTYPGSGGAQDLVSGLTGRPLQSGGLSAAGSGGSAAFTSIIGGGVVWPFPPRLETITNQFTVAFRGAPSTTAARSIMVSIPYAAATYVNPRSSIAMLGESDGTGSMWYAGTAAALRFADCAAGWFNSTDRQILWAGVRNNGVSGFYRNGRLHTAGTFSADEPVLWTNRQPLVILQRSSTSAGENFKGTADFAAIWNRPLTETELAQLTADIYCLLMSPSWRRYRASPAVAAGRFSRTLVGVGR